MGISINGPSGIDTGYIIDSLVNLERNKVRTVERQKSAYQVKIEAYSRLTSFLNDIGSRANSLSTALSFNLYKESTSNDSLVTISGGTGTVAGRYDIGVYQTARSEKLISRDGIVTSQSTALSALGFTPGSFTINGVEITTDDDDTIQDLRMKINNATTSDGKKIGVTASVLKTSDNNFRLVLTSSSTGKAGAEYKDVSGNMLQSLGIIGNADGDKGITNQKIATTGGFSASTGDTVTFAGLDHEGNAVSGTFVMTPSSTTESLLQGIRQAFRGTVDVSIDGGGHLVIESKTGGRSQLSLTDFSVNGTPQATTVAVAGDQSDSVLSVGRDSYYSVDGLLLESSSNSVTGVISGVTLNLKKASMDELVTVEIERDYDKLTGKVDELFNAFNALVRFAKESSVYGNPKDEKSKKGELAGDMTLSSIVSQLRMTFQRPFDTINSNYTSFAAIGLKTDTKTSELSIDKDLLKEALVNDFEEVVRMFASTGISSQSGIKLGRNTNDTQAGKYVVEEIDSNQRVRIWLESDPSTTWESGPRVGDIVTFSDGPVKGLSLTLPPETLQAGQTASFNFSKGLSSYLKEMADQLVDTREGTVALRQASWRRSIENADKRITKLEASIEKYRERLVKQFAAMEQTMSTLQGQGGRMMSALKSLERR